MKIRVLAIVLVGMLAAGGMMAVSLARRGAGSAGADAGIGSGMTHLRSCPSGEQDVARDADKIVPDSQTSGALWSSGMTDLDPDEADMEDENGNDAVKALAQDGEDAPADAVPRHPLLQRATTHAQRGQDEDVVALVALSDAAPSEGLRNEVLLELSTVTNPVARQALLDTLVIGDQALADAAQEALANAHDSQWAAHIAVAYDAEIAPEAKTRIADSLSQVRDPSAEMDLRALSADLDEGEDGPDELWFAAADALGNVGTTQAVATLVQRITEAEANQTSLPAYDAMLGALSRVDNPESRPMLIALVQGGLAGEIQADAYWAAIRALRFHPDPTVRALLTQVAQSEDKTFRGTAEESIEVLDRLARPESLLRDEL